MSEVSETGSLGEFESPSEELVEEVLSRLGDLQHRRVFYDGLENPKWVKPLNKAGAFSDVPVTVVDDDGFIRITPWPPGEYLVRMAPLVPTEVMSVLAPLVETTDPAPLRILTQAAAALPAENAKALVPAILRYIASPVRHWVDPALLVSIISNLATAGFLKEAERIAQALLRPVPAPSSLEDEFPVPRQKAVAAMEEHAYHRALPAVREALAPLGLKTLTLLTIWLEEYQLHSGHYFPDSGRDVSTINRPSIASHKQNRGFNRMGDSLVDAVRDEALSLLGRGHELAAVLAVLDKSKQPLLRRIAIHTIGEAVDMSIDGCIEAARAILHDPSVLGSTYRNEYVNVARRLLPKMEADEQTAWTDWVLSGPFIDEETLHRRAAYYAQDGEKVEDVLHRYQEVWRLDVLAGIGRESLPSAAVENLEQLVQTYGEPEHPDFPNWMEVGFVEHKPPTEAEHLADMSTAEVLAFLDDWQPDESERRFDAPSIDGLARTLQGDVTKRPWAYAAVADRFADKRPIYVAHVLRGLSDALEKADPPAWQPVIGLLQAVSRWSDVAEPGSSDHFADDRREPQSAALEVVGHVLRRPGPLPSDLLQNLVVVLENLALSPDPSGEFETKYGGDNMDPMTLSLNTIRPTAIATMSDLLLRLRSGNTTGTVDELATRVERKLQERMGPSVDDSLAVAAAFGRSMGKLLDANPDWVRDVQPVLLGGASSPTPYSDVVLTTMLATYYPSAKLIGAVEEHLLEMLRRENRGSTVHLGWRRERRAAELLGDHVVELIVRGDLPLTAAIVQTYFAEATVEDRASSLGHLGWLLGQADGDIAEEVLSRARELINWRVEEVHAGGDAGELAGFGWWAIFGRFPATWWLPVLEVAAQSGRLDTHGSLGEVLEQACQHDPPRALSVLDRLLETRTEPFERYGLVEHAPAVIAAALDSGKDETVEQARRLMNRLGRQGEQDLDAAVQRARSSKS